MLTLHQVDTRSKADVRRFVHFPFKLYRNNPYWVPPILVDATGQLNRHKHPFYEHSTAGFWIAVRDGEDVGRIAGLAAENDKVLPMWWDSRDTASGDPYTRVITPP